MNRGRPVAVVTDSTSDLDPELARELGIEIVPLFVNFGDRRYLDEVDLSRDLFYAKLENEAVLPTTSQPTAAMFEEVFRPHVEAGRPIVGIFISSKLSGTINAAHAAAQSFPDAEIELIDSYTVTGGVGLLATHAGELSQRGASCEEIVHTIERDRLRQHGYATVPDLSHAVRTGRVSRTMAAIGNVLKVVPVLRFSEKGVEEETRVRTFAKALDTMIEATAKAIEDPTTARIIVMHARAREVAERLVVKLTAALPASPLRISIGEAGPALAVHAGAGATGIFSIP